MRKGAVAPLRAAAGAIVGVALVLGATSCRDAGPPDAPRTSAEAAALLGGRDFGMRLATLDAIRSGRVARDAETSAALVRALDDPLWPDVAGEIGTWRREVIETIASLGPLDPVAALGLISVSEDDDAWGSAQRALEADRGRASLDALVATLRTGTPSKRYWMAFTLSRRLEYGRAVAAELEPLSAEIVAFLRAELQHPAAWGTGAPLVELAKWGEPARVALPDVMEQIDAAEDPLLASIAVETAIGLGASLDEVARRVRRRSDRGEPVLNLVTSLAGAMTQGRAGADAERWRAFAAQLARSELAENRVAASSLLGAVAETRDDDERLLRALVEDRDELVQVGAISALQTHGRMDPQLARRLDELSTGARSADARSMATALRLRAK